jgi:putative glutamate/gamma-aminobutyrate antiporter
MTKPKSLNVFLLTMINISTILSIRNWPLTADFGFSLILYVLLAALLFLIPISLIAAELATGWPEKGGIFVWVKEALGHKWGFLAVWLLWVENVVYYPLLLSFVAGTLAFVFNPALADSRLFTFSVIVLSFWLFTLINLRGMKTSGWVSTTGVVVGTFIPGLLIIGLGISWFKTGNPIHIEMSWKALIPKINSMDDIVLLTGVILAFAGMEMPAIHANDVINPRKNYPKAIFIAAFIIVILSILGSLAIACVIPHSDISLTGGSMAVIYHILNSYGLQTFIPLVAIMIMIGALGTLSTWIAGPCRGLLAATESGDFPAYLHKENKQGMPVVMMLLQGIIVTILALSFFIFPDVKSSFMALVVLSVELYLIMYTLMFISVIILRYKKPHVKRGYEVPFGKKGVWITSGIGMITALVIFIIGLYPPSNLTTLHTILYEAFLIGGIAIFCIIPFLISKRRVHKL